MVASGSGSPTAFSSIAGMQSAGGGGAQGTLRYAGMTPSGIDDSVNTHLPGNDQTHEEVYRLLRCVP